MDEHEATRIMEKAAAALGKPSRQHLTMREHRTRDQRGWIAVGSLTAGDTGQAYQVYWHPERQRGWLWALIMLPHGVVPRRFEPPDESRMES